MKYIDILVNLDKKVLKMYRKWLDFSFSGKSKHLKSLALFMLNEHEKQEGKLDVYYKTPLKKDAVEAKQESNKYKIRNAAWEAMYPQKGEYSRIYNERDLDREVSKITQNLESFLFYYYSKEKEVEKNMMLVQKYSDWGLDEWAAQLIQDTDRILTEHHYRYNDAARLIGYKLQYELIFLRNNSKKELYLQQYNYFIADWISQAMYQICTMKVKPLDQEIPEDSLTFLEELVLKWIETYPEITQKKDIKLFYKVYKVHTDFSNGKGSVAEIKKLMCLMQKFEGYPKPDNIKNMYRILFHAVNRIPEKDEKLTILWELYTLGIKTELIFVNGLMLPQDLLNIQKLRRILNISATEWAEKVGDMPHSKKTIEIYEKLLAKLTKVQDLFKQKKYEAILDIYWGENVHEKAYYEYYKFQIKMYYLLAKFALQNPLADGFFERIRIFKQELGYFAQQVEQNKELLVPYKKKFTQTVSILILLIQKKYISSKQKTKKQIEDELAAHFKDETFEVYEKEFLWSKMS